MFLTRFTHWVLRRLGWRFDGSLPEPAKSVVIGAPHTSNWDFIVFMGAVHAYRIDAHFLGKHTLFWWPLSLLLRSLGGIPVDRSAPGGLVRQVAAEFKRSETMVLVVAPEGTRKAVPHWKSGFVRLADGAGVPVVPAAIDCVNKVVTLGPPIFFEGDIDAFMDRIRAAFEGAAGFKPEGQGPILLAEEKSGAL